jgi:hypothetical protein
VCTNELLLCAVYCCLQRCASLECWNLCCFDLDCFSSAGVTAGTCCTFAYFECAETNQSDIVTLLQRSGDDIDQRCNIAVCICFGATCLVGQGIYQFFSVHVFSLSSECCTCSKHQSSTSCWRFGSFLHQAELRIQSFVLVFVRVFVRVFVWAFAMECSRRDNGIPQDIPLPVTSA